MRFQNIAGRLVDVIFGYDFFVSYTWADGSKYAHSLYEKLKAQGFTVFLDEEEYARGDNWTLLGRRALRKTRQLILVATPRVHQSAPVLKELTAFQSTGRRIIPIEIGDSLNPLKYSESLLLPLIPAELLKINQPLQQDAIPNEAPPEVVRELRRGFQHVRQTQIRVRVLLGACLVLLGLLSIAVWQGIVAELQRREANRQKQEAIQQQRIAVARQLAAQGALANTQQADLLQQSVLLGVEAVSRLPSPETEQGLRERVALLPRLLFSFSGRGWITTIVISPDGKQIAAIGGQTAHVREVASGREIATLQHDDIIESVAFSPDGRYVATGSLDRTARIWDAASGAEVTRLPHDDQVNSVVFSPDGAYLATTIYFAANHSNYAYLWEVTTGRQVLRVAHDDRRAIEALRFAPDGRHFATASWDGTVRVWEAASGREVWRFAHDGKTVHTIAYDRSGKIMVSGSEDGRVREWDLRTGKEIAALAMSHQGPVRDVTFSPDDRLLATGSEDHTARVWDAKSGRELSRMPHGANVVSVSFSPDGREIATTGDGHAARLWDVSTGQETARAIHEASVNAAAFSPDGRFFASGSGHTQVKGNGSALVDPAVRVWDLNAERTISRFAHQGSIGEIAFSPDGRSIATASWDHTARVWDSSTGAERFRVVHNDRVFSVAISGDSQRVATGSEDGSVRLLDLSNGRETTLSTAVGKARALSFSPDGKHLAMGTIEGVARVWDLAAKVELFQLRHPDVVASVSYSTDGRYLLTHTDKVVHLWNANDGREWKAISISSDVHEASWSPDSQLVAARTGDDVRVWSVRDGVQLSSLRHEGDWVKAFAWHPDSRRLLTWDNNVLRLWDTRTGRVIRQFFHEDTFRVAFTPDGKHVVVIGGDRAARLWEIETGREVAVLLHPSDLYNVSVSPDGRHIATIDGGNVVTVWLWCIEDVIVEAQRRLTRNLTFEEWQRYFGNEPYRKTCPNLPIHLSVIEATLKLARDGDQRGFLAMAQRVEALEPAIKGSLLKAKGQRLAAVGNGERAARKGEELIRVGKAGEGLTLLKAAQAAFAEAQRLGGANEISVDQWNRIGWFGSVWGRGSDFLYSCDQAVAAAPSMPEPRDSRGVARAMTGDFAGAIEDLEIFVKSGKAGKNAQRRLRWIEALRKGANPFTREEIEQLRRE